MNCISTVSDRVRKRVDAGVEPKWLPERSAVRHLEQSVRDSLRAYGHDARAAMRALPVGEASSVGHADVDPVDSRESGVAGRQRRLRLQRVNRPFDIPTAPTLTSALRSGVDAVTPVRRRDPSGRVQQWRNSPWLTVRVVRTLPGLVIGSGTAPDPGPCRTVNRWIVENVEIPAERFFTDWRRECERVKKSGRDTGPTTRRGLGVTRRAQV